MTRPGEEQRQLEIERGMQRVAVAKRKSDLNRYIEGKKVHMTTALHNHPFYEPHGQVNIFYVDGVDIGHENHDAPDYPSEVLMAKIALAVAATVGTDGIPDANLTATDVQQRRDDYRRHLGAWRRAHGQE